MIRSIDKNVRRRVRPAVASRLLAAPIFAALLLSSGCLCFEFHHESERKYEEDQHQEHDNDHASLTGTEGRVLDAG